MIRRLRSLRNTLAFSLRRRVAFARGVPPLAREDKAELFLHLSGPARDRAIADEVRLRARYGLEALRRDSSLLDYADSLLLLEGLERLAPEPALPPQGVRAVDVGSKSFAYALALARFLERAGGGRRAVELTGVEIDGHGIYRDGYSRADHGAAAAARVEGATVRYQVADFLETRWPPLDVVSLFFPFVRERALLQWGLPLSLFRPDALVARAVSALAPGGRVISFHQTQDEAEEMTRLLTAAGARVVARAGLASGLVPYAEATEDRVGLVAAPPLRV